MSLEQAQIKQPSTMDDLLIQLDEQVGRYSRIINSVRSSRTALLESAPNLDAQKIGDPRPGFTPGIFYRLDNLIDNMRSLNTEAEQEAQYLKNYL